MVWTLLQWLAAIDCPSTNRDDRRICFRFTHLAIGVYVRQICAGKSECVPNKSSRPRSTLTLNSTRRPHRITKYNSGRDGNERTPGLSARASDPRDHTNDNNEVSERKAASAVAVRNARGLGETGISTRS